VNHLFVMLGIESWKPILAALVLPPVPFLLLILIGARLLLPRRGLGWLLIFFSVVMLWLSACSGAARVLGQLLLQPPAAMSFDRVRELKAEVQAKKPVAIVVLGAGVEPFAPEYGVSSLQYPSLERLRYGLWLARETGAPSPSAAASAGGRPTRRPRPRSRPRSPPTNSRCRSSGRRTIRATPARTRRARWRCSSRGHRPHRPRHPRLSTCRARCAPFTEAAGQRQSRSSRRPMGQARRHRSRRRSSGCRARAASARCADAARAARQGRGGLRCAGPDGCAWHGSSDRALPRADGETTRSTTPNDGPLQGPEEPSIPKAPRSCHSVLVASARAASSAGDSSRSESRSSPRALRLVTTPRRPAPFYRSLGEPATQSLEVRAEAGARLEWLPLETLAYSGCIGENRARFALAPGAEMIGWDVTALGLPASDQPFVADASPSRSSCPAAGSTAARSRATRRRCSIRRSAGPASGRSRRSGSAPARRCMPTVARALLEAARAACDAHPLASRAGCSAVDPGVIVLRVLARGSSRRWMPPARRGSRRRLAAARRGPARGPRRPRVWRT
jgi:urease accessory protein UreH